jgi:hypothetical protein
MNLTDLVIPPWVKIGLQLLPVVALVGGIGWLDWSRNSWKATAASEKTTIAQRDDTISQLRGTIISMTTAQDNQSKISHFSIERVVQGPTEVQTIIKRIHDAPIPPKCETPDLAFAKANT